jgi:hypothetical protein
MTGPDMLVSQTSQFGGNANRRSHGVLVVESNTVARASSCPSALAANSMRNSEWNDHLSIVLIV